MKNETMNLRLTGWSKVISQPNGAILKLETNRIARDGSINWKRNFTLMVDLHEDSVVSLVDEIWKHQKHLQNKATVLKDSLEGEYQDESA